MATTYPAPRKATGTEKLLGGMAILAVVAGMFFLLGPSGRIPLMDANRTLLAETPAEATCAAEAHFGHQGQEAFNQCVAESDRGSDIDIPEIPQAFCEGVKKAGWPGTLEECKQIVASNQLWPTKELSPQGWLSNNWNRRFPYPGSLVGAGGGNTDNSRTGDRGDGNLRTGEESTR